MTRPMHAASLRIAVVGPTHPHKGGVAAHTTTLAHELADAGHDVRLVGWSQLYPAFLYPGEQAVPGGSPDVEPFPGTTHSLSWARPDSWLLTGRRLSDVDAIVLVHVIPQVVPAHLAILRAAGAGRTAQGAYAARRHPPRTILVTHNVLPHETRPGDKQLVGVMLRRTDAVIVHSDEQARLAVELGADRVRQVPLPPHLPGGEPSPRPAHEGRTRLLSLGIVRDYKGVDILLEAAAEVDGVEVTVAGEMWGDAGRRVKELAADPRLRDRVRVHGGYVPADRIAELMAHHDVVALTYRHATASQNVLLARRHGMPVLATRVGTFGSEIRDGVDGLLVPPTDRDALVAALRSLADPAYVARLRSAVTAPDLHGPWADYVGAIEALASREAVAAPLDAGAAGGPDAAGTARDGVRGAITGAASKAKDAVSAARQRRAPRLELRPGDIPEWVRPSDVLAIDADALDARDTARDLGLPRATDAVAAWAALGALAAIVRIRDGVRRDSVVVEESGARSPLSRWLRAVGFAPVELELTGARSAVEALDVDTASLDVVTRVHPGGCSADDVDEVLSQASWALRSGGLLVITLPVGDDDPEWAVRPADLRGVLARADDLGLALVGDLDGDLEEGITGRLRRAAKVAADARAASEEEPAPAYGIIRLTFRRR